MATTYSTNSDLTLFTGFSIEDQEFGFKTGLTNAQKTALQDTMRLKAYNFINDKLRGKTAIPANHIDSLKQIEVDLVFSYMIRDSHVLQTMNTTEWQDKYEQSVKLLEMLQFPASSDDPVPDDQNTGNGTMTVHELNDFYTKTERWIFRANNNNQFSVTGDKSGSYPTLTVDIKYPESDWTDWEKYPFYVTINSGTIDFVQDDKFILETYASRYSGTSIGMIKRA